MGLFTGYFSENVAIVGFFPSRQCIKMLCMHVVSNAECYCRSPACAGRELVVPLAGPGSMVKAQKSAGRRSSHCHRTQVLNNIDVIV